MSHFTVLVVGSNPEEQLAPYQENNMGNCPDEYMEFHSTEEKYLEQYENETVDKVVMPDGRLLNKWDEEFRKRGSFGLGGGTHEVPAGLEIRKVPFKELYNTFEEFVADWCGDKERDEKIGKYGYWENPNRKWDWYELGGRWMGFFKLKSPNMKATLGNPGVFGNSPEHDADQAMKGQIDFAGMMDKSGEEAKERYERVERLFGGSIPKLEISWKEDMFDGGKYENLDIDEKRKIYNEQPAMKAQQELKDKVWNDKENPDRDFIIWLELSAYQCSKEEYIDQSRNNSFVTFAVVKDGKWFEKGEMGWWGCVSNEKDQKEWNNQFCSMVLDLPDDTLLSLYDCHI
jgi:hypothetical protein